MGSNHRNRHSRHTSLPWGRYRTRRLPDHALKLYGHAVGVSADQANFEFKFRVVRRHGFESSIFGASDHKFFQDLELSIGEREPAQAATPESARGSIIQ